MVTMIQQQTSERCSRRRCEGPAMGAVSLDLRPGSGLGPFTLGMPIGEAFDYITQDPRTYDVVHVKYHESEPFILDILVSFPDHGFHLRFEPHSQRLRIIEVTNVQRLQMRYSNYGIGGSNTLATFAHIYAVCGPTFPGDYDAEKALYTLFYPGLSFAFPIPSLHKELCKEGPELPLEFPDGTTPVTSRVCIYDMSSGNVGIAANCTTAIVPPLPSGSIYMEEVHAELGKGLWFRVGDQHLPFGASPQDVWSELGRPCAIHQKQVDPMVIHSTSDSSPKTTFCGDYFYNYFARGLDILFDGQTHKIKKFVLHTNFPGHADFYSFVKCNFVIHLPHSENQTEDEKRQDECITPSTNWKEVQKFDNEWKQSVVKKLYPLQVSSILDNLLSVPRIGKKDPLCASEKKILGDGGRAAIQTQGSTNNPFGPTYVYGYPHIAFEIMKNGYIATVTLF